MDPIREELQADLVATLAASRELPPEANQHLAAAYLDRVQNQLNRREASLSCGEERRPTRLLFVEAVSGASSAIVGLLAIVSAHQALVAHGAIFLGMGYSAQHGKIAFSQVTNVVNPFVAVVSVILVVIGVAAYRHAVYRGRAALRFLGGGTLALLGAVLVAIGFPGTLLSDLLSQLLWPGFVPVVALATVTLAFVAFLAGSISQPTVRRRAKRRFAATSVLRARP